MSAIFPRDMRVQDVNIANITKVEHEDILRSPSVLSRFFMFKWQN
jgi:hypothetical protein